MPINLDLASHCIGLDNKKPYKRHGRLFYKPYRNYFTSAPKCNGFVELEKMVLLGYMGRSEINAHGGFTYWLTREGLNWLGNQLNITIYDEEV